MFFDWDQHSLVRLADLARHKDWRERAILAEGVLLFVDVKKPPK